MVSTDRILQLGRMYGVPVECVLVSHTSNRCNTTTDTTSNHRDCGRDSKTDTSTTRQRPVTNTDTNTAKGIWLVSRAFCLVLLTSTNRWVCGDGSVVHLRGPKFPGRGRMVAQSVRDVGAGEKPRCCCLHRQ